MRTVAATSAGELDERVLPAALRTELANDPRRAVVLSRTAAVTPEERGSAWRIDDGDATYLLRRQEDRLRVSELLASRLGFRHILFFAWFCNLAMHVGLSDMAVFRYARHWSYGFYSAFGMYLGHFFAWLCAGVMGAVVWGEVNPGKMADHALGVAGLICVLIAGWTTANPTIYRAGLALQVITPDWPRWKVTLVAGGVTTVVAMFPAIFMKLLDFVAIYGLILMPIGAIVVTEHWLFPRLGLRPCAGRRRRAVDPPALIAWLAVLLLCFPIEDFTGGRLPSPMHLLGVHLFFRWLPGWFLAAGLYLVLTMLGRAKAAKAETESEADAESETTAPTAEQGLPPTARGNPSPLATMHDGMLSTAARIAGAVAILALLACLVLPLRVFIAGGADPVVYQANLAQCKQGMFLATLIYFVAGTYWHAKREKTRASD